MSPTARPTCGAFAFVGSPREWSKFCSVMLQKSELLAHERFSSNSRRVANRDVLRELGWSAADVGRLRQVGAI